VATVVGRAAEALRRRASTARAVRPYAGLLRPGGAGYLGWAGQGNLGDDLMYAAHRQALRPVALTAAPVASIEARLGPLARVPGGVRVKGMLLGGGTLFGRADWRARIEATRAFTGAAPWMALGVGVEDAEFAAGRRFTDADELGRWAELAAEWPVLGVRGPRSAELLAAHGLTAPVTGDPALLLAGLRPPAAVRERLLGVSLAVPEARWGDAARSAAVIDAALDGLAAEGWRFRFFEFSRWDRERTAAARSRLGARAAAFAGGDVAALLRALGECHVVLGERLHAVVMAAAAATPAIGVEYRPKLRDFLRSVDRGALAVRTDGPAPDLRAAVLDLAERRDAESAHLVAAVDARAARLHEAAAAAVAVCRMRT
jgi:polysaccharide pyruvyl transferase